MAGVFGLDEVIVADAAQWARSRPATTGLTPGAPGTTPGERAEPGYDLVVDAIGHDQEVLEAAVRMVATFGHIVVYGLPESHVVFPMWAFLRKNATLSAGTTRRWRPHLTTALEHLRRHPALHQVGVTHRYSLDRIEEAFELHLRPATGRLKVLLEPPAGV